MKNNIIVIDDFYDNALEVRQFVLQQPFDVRGNYPGARTKSFATDELKKTFESIIGRKITYWPDGYNGAFQYTTKDHRSWIHRDLTRWGAVLYLTPDAPLTAGTAFFRHKRTGLEECPAGTAKELCEELDNDSNDMSKWDQVDNVGNKFNRLILFRGTRSHRSMDYFGENKENGRLFQLFFFNTEE